MLPHAPATHGSRTTILQKLHSAMTALNEKLRKDKNSSNRCFVLTPDELITMALDEEEKFARDSPSVYGNVIKLRIVRVTKMGTDEWAKEVMSHLNARYYKINPVQSRGRFPGLSTRGSPHGRNRSCIPASHTSHWPRRTRICHKAAYRCRCRNRQERR
jgi:hypothetical protein